MSKPEAGLIGAELQPRFSHERRVKVRYLKSGNEEVEIEVSEVAREKGTKLVAQNKKARHDYFIVESFECGVVLTGTEVKSLRAGRASLLDGFAQIKDGEIWLSGVHIPEYNEGSWTNHEPRRERKLLLHKEEISKLIGKSKESGATMVPLSIYFKDGKVKIELALAKGKKAHDKRATLMEKQAEREVERAISQRASGRAGRAISKYEDD